MIYWFSLGLIIFASVVIPLSKENEQLKDKITKLETEIKQLKHQ